VEINWKTEGRKGKFGKRKWEVKVKKINRPKYNKFQ
jgi:hypothetical protein